MSSSTSNSRAALAAVGFVFAVLSLCELALRLGEESISIDVAHLRSIPAIANRLNAGEGKRVLFLGSSIVREGVNLEDILQGIHDSGIDEPLTFEKVHPDDSRIAEWTYLVEHHFINPGRLPDVIVIGFAGSHLEDYHPIPWDRIAAYYASTQALPRIVFEEIDNFETRVQFVLAHFIRSFAYRERVGKRVFDLVVPHYRDSSRRINASLRREQLVTKQGEVEQYGRLEKLAELTNRHGVAVILVAMPLRANWEIPAELPKRASEIGVTLLDARNIPDFGQELFKDGLHMNATGAERFSKWLPTILAPSLLETNRRAPAAAADININPGRETQPDDD